jgi:predicted nucleic acid-binding Zn ribbon protein
MDNDLKALVEQCVKEHLDAFRQEILDLLRPVKKTVGRPKHPREILTCLGCGRQFQKATLDIPVKPVCSPECGVLARNKARFHQANCAGCGREFMSCSSYAKKYCTMKCKGIASWTERREKSIALWNGGMTCREIARELKCSYQRIHQLVSEAERDGLLTQPFTNRTTPKDYGTCQCGKPIPSLGRKYCSQECASKCPKKDARWSRKILLDLKCHQCGKDFQRTQYQHAISTRFTKHTYCSRICFHLSRRTRCLPTNESSNGRMASST